MNIKQINGLFEQALAQEKRRQSIYKTDTIEIFRLVSGLGIFTFIPLFESANEYYKFIIEV